MVDFPVKSAIDAFLFWKVVVDFILTYMLGFSCSLFFWWDFVTQCLSKNWHIQSIKFAATDLYIIVLCYPAIFVELGVMISIYFLFWWFVYSLLFLGKPYLILINFIDIFNKPNVGCFSLLFSCLQFHWLRLCYCYLTFLLALGLNCTSSSAFQRQTLRLLI